MRWMLLMAVLGLAAAPPAFGDPWKDESGHGRGRGGDEWKQEFRSGNCAVERKWERGGEYKEEIKCDGPPWLSAFADRPPVAGGGWVDPPAGLPPLPQGPAYGGGFRDPSGRYCREYETTGVIDGRPRRLFGTACLQPDGTWVFNN